MNDIYFIVGGPGSGKGTQCKIITNNVPNTVHISAGDLLRRESISNSEIKFMLDNGLIVPSYITIRLLIQEIVLNDGKIILIDGFPRCLEQGIEFEETVSSLDYKIKKVIYLSADDSIMTERLLNRCLTYVNRTDDNEEIIPQRIERHKLAINFIIDYYGEKVNIIDSNGTIETVSCDVARIFRE